MSSLKELRESLGLQRELADACEQMLAFATGEEREETLSNQSAALEEIKLLEAQIATIEAANAAKNPPVSSSPSSALPPPPPSPPPPPPPQEASITFDVKDVVQARYSEDRQWYKAVIMAKTGSSADPVYTVKFSGYGNTENRRKNDIRPLFAEGKKRKADGTPVAPATASWQTPALATASPKPVNDGSVISAAPTVDTSLVQKKEPSKVSDGPTRMAPAPKKLKGSKALEKNKASWQEWNKNGPKKGGGSFKKKESMFRTPDVPGAKVGFGTVTGQAMTKDQKRQKWDYTAEEEE